MASDYTFEKPATPLDEGIVAFIEDFYRISDIPDALDLYVSQFTPEAKVALGNQRFQGTKEITGLRQAMWATVKARKHKVHRVFTSATDSPELMLYGTVAYEMKDGSKPSKDWAGRAVFEKSASTGKWQLSFYQVYLDMAN